MNWTGYFQQFGRSLMLPMIALPAAAILLLLGHLPWEILGLHQFSDILFLAGNAIFTYLPYIFAVGVALGLTDNAANAGMAALMSYFLFNLLVRYFTDTSMNIGVTGSIFIGLITAVSYHKFKNIRFPEYIQFFGGPRFVPLFMSLVTILLSYIFILISPFIEQVMEMTSEFLLGLGGFGAFLYGVLHRLLVPTGLHHVINNVFWFQVDRYTREDGVVVFGDLPRFFAGDPEAGTYMAGLYVVMMFSLPAIAFAIIHEAREDLKPKVKKTFMTAALASFLTGVTEPIEFAFLFVAPVLFFIHAILSGLAMWIVYALDVHHGFAFSAGAIDFLINAHLGQNIHRIILVGIVYGIVYYVLFRWAIRKFQIPTPGREDGSALDDWAGDIPYKAPLVLEALGGKNNIVQLEACITRLRITLSDERKLDQDAMKQLGAAGVIQLGGGNVQIVFGTFSELLREEIVKLMRKDLQQVHFHAPVQGKMIALADVPDQTFSQKLVGEGVAFIPERGELVSPLAGKVIHLHPAKHAIGIESKEGLEVLVHIGIDTAFLEGDWFAAEVQEGQQVSAGQTLIRFNLSKLRKFAKSMATPMVVTNTEMVKSWNFAPYKTVKKGQSSVMSIVLREKEQTDGGKKNVN